MVNPWDLAESGGKKGSLSPCSETECFLSPSPYMSKEAQCPHPASTGSFSNTGLMQRRAGDRGGVGGGGGAEGAGPWTSASEPVPLFDVDYVRKRLSVFFKPLEAQLSPPCGLSSRMSDIW